MELNLERTMELNRRTEETQGTLPRIVRIPGFVFTLGVHPAGSILPPHTHDDPTICYVLRGGFTEYSRGDAAECEAATLKLTPAGEPHWNRFNDAETRGLRIDVDRRRFANTPSLFRVLDERLYSKGGVTGDLAKRLVYELSSDDDAGLVAAEGLALELLAELSREPEPRGGRRPPHWLFVADELIHAAYAQRVALGDIATTVGVHPATLARGYRRTFGCTVGERIRRLRVEHAARALLETTEPLSEVALDAGFYDQSHLTNAFRRHFGVTPAEYRARMR